MFSEINNIKIRPLSSENGILDLANRPLKTPEYKDTIYPQKTLEPLKQIQDKRLNKKDELDIKRKKKIDEKERIKQQQGIDELGSTNEQKLKYDDLHLPEIKDAEDINKTSKKYKSINQLDDQDIQQQDQQASKQLENYFRSRHASFLMTLQENIKKQKMIEETAKKKKELMIAKIRENLGMKNINSKFFDGNKQKENSNNQQYSSGSSTINHEMNTTNQEIKRLYNRAQSVEKKERINSGEDPKVMIDKQKKYEKKVSQEEEKLSREKNSRNEQRKKNSLNNEEKKNKTMNNFNKSTSTTINGLDLPSSGKKVYKEHSNNALAIIKDMGVYEDNEDYDECDNNSGENEENDENDQSNKNNINNQVGALNSKKKKKKIRLLPNITDVSQWRKRHRLDPETKIFMVLGGYSDLKTALEARGWIENPDPNSSCFDLKWTLKAKDINHEILTENQVVNHFEKNTSITTKVGLCKSLRNLVWFANVDIDTFYPRGFDLSDPNDYQDFIEEFKSVKAESILKNYLKAQKLNIAKLSTAAELRVKIALSICERKLVDLDELLEDQALICENLITQEEWEILADDELNQESLAKKKHEAWLVKYDVQNSSSKLSQNPNQKGGADIKNKPKKKKKKSQKMVNNQVNNDEEGCEDEEKEDGKEEKNELLQRVEKCCEAMRVKYPQFDLNGDKNIWIIKPAGLSRGRGIEVFRNLVEIEDHVKGKEAQWFAQKYIENPLIIKDKKFDIRQWVLVTDWNPLTVWYYEECYVRFSAEKWDINKLEDKFIHLTNNSIAKYSENFENSEIDGNMWTSEEFQNNLNEVHGSDIFNNSIKPKMKQIVIWSLQCVQDMIENRKNSIELYGYDFMVDSNMNPWLIEINSSPAMDYSTTVTERLVKMVMEDIAKVVVDYGMSKKKKKGDIDTGLFTCIHKSKKTMEKPLNSFGLDLVCEGKSIKKGY